MLPHLFELVPQALTAVVDPNYNPHHIIRTLSVLTAASEHFSLGHSSRSTSKGAREPANAKWDT